MIIISNACPICGDVIDVTIDAKQVEKIKLGLDWIHIFNGDVDMAERFISGTCPECWEKLFPEEVYI